MLLPRLSRYDEFNPSTDEREAFDWGTESLNDWLVRYAGQAMKSRDAVTYLIHEGREILAFFALSSGSVALGHPTAVVGGRAPDPVPMVLLGRMGVDTEHKGRGLGVEAVRQTGKKAIAVAE